MVSLFFSDVQIVPPFETRKTDNEVHVPKAAENLSTDEQFGANYGTKY